jgi:predicted DNA-binding ribbon-helix-helix protein
MARKSKGPFAKSHLLKKSIYVGGGKTRSIALEEAFWAALQKIAANQSVAISELVATVDRNREHANLSSTIRLYVLDYFQRGAMTPR